MPSKHNYIPFLKFKSNEVAGLSVLSDDLKSKLTPFFDLPRRDGMTAAQFEKSVAACRKKVDKYLFAFPAIYVDSFDIPDSIAVAGKPNCRKIIETFGDSRYIPVLGLDRSVDHNQTIIDAKAAGEIVSDVAAIRLQAEDFSSFALVGDELIELIEGASHAFSRRELIFDCRVCLTSNRSKLAADIASFVQKIRSKADIQQFIVAGSSIPATITDIARPSDESIIARAELEIYHAAEAIVGEDILSLADYTIVSPTYSELSIPPELLLTVTVPKVFYTFENNHYIARGGRISSKGYGQYDDICVEIAGKKFFRGPTYSKGDEFIQSRADGLRVKNITPSTILKPTICAHITYMAVDYSN